MILNKFKLPTLLIIILFIGIKTSSQDKILLSGKITDQQSNKNIEFANIGIEGKNIGTISNEDGDFELFIPKNYNNDSLIVSYMGYKTYKVKISGIKNKYIIIELQTIDIEIEEVVVSALSPIEMLKLVLNKIPVNYSTKPYMATGFYREIVKENNQSIEILEAVLEFYKSSYSSHKEVDQARIIKGRNMVSKNPEVFNNLKVSGGPLGGIDYDIIKYKASFLQTEKFRYYEYEYSNSTKYNGKTVYVISFDQKSDVKKPLFKGQLFIDIHSLAIVSVRYQFSPRGIKYKKASFKERAKMKFFGLSMKYRKVDVVVNYEEKRGKWYFKNVFLEAVFSFNNVKANKTALIYFSQNLLITNRNLTNVHKIPENKQINRNSHMGDETWEYDEEFWKGYNTIKVGREVKKNVNEIEKTNQ